MHDVSTALGASYFSATLLAPKNLLRFLVEHVGRRRADLAEVEADGQRGLLLLAVFVLLFFLLESQQKVK